MPMMGLRAVPELVIGETTTVPGAPALATTLVTRPYWSIVKEEGYE
jgi:hypothetical protein